MNTFILQNEVVFFMLAENKVLTWLLQPITTIAILPEECILVNIISDLNNMLLVLYMTGPARPWCGHYHPSVSRLLTHWQSEMV